MKKRNLNFLLAAGMVTLFGANTAQAVDLSWNDTIESKTGTTDAPDRLVVPAEGEQFETITIGVPYTPAEGETPETPASSSVLNIDLSAGSVNAENGTINMHTGSTLQLSDAVHNLTFNTLYVNQDEYIQDGEDPESITSYPNLILQTATNTTNDIKTSWETTTIEADTDLVIRNNGGIIDAGAVTLNGSSENSYSSLILEGNSQILADSIALTGSGYNRLVISNTATNTNIGNLTLNNQENAFLEGLTKTNHSSISLTGNNAINLINSSLNNIRLNSGTRTNINNLESNSTSSLDQITMTAGTSSTPTVLNFNTKSNADGTSKAILNINSIYMNGYNNITTDGVNIGTTTVPNITYGEVNVTNLNVTGAENNITANGEIELTNITLAQGTDTNNKTSLNLAAATNTSINANTINLNGLSNLVTISNGNIVTNSLNVINASNTITTNAQTNLGTVQVGDSENAQTTGELSIIAKANTQLATAYVNKNSTLKLKADTANININAGDGDGLINLDNSTLQLEGTNSITTPQINTSGNSTITSTNTNTNSSLGNIDISEGTATTKNKLTLNANSANAKINATSISMKGNNIIETEGTGNILTNSLDVVNASNTITTNAQTNLGTVQVGDSTNSGNLEITANALTTLGQTSINNTTSTLDLTANSGALITSEKVTIAGSNNAFTVSGEGDITVSNIDVNADSLITDLTTNGAVLGNVTIADGLTVALDGIKSSVTRGAGESAEKHTNNIIFTGSATVNATNSNLGDFTVNETEEISINSVSGTNNIGNATLNAGTQDNNTILNLDAATNSTLIASEINMKGNNKLNITNSGNVNITDVKINNTYNNAIVNNNANTEITNIVTNKSGLNIEAQKDISVTNLTLNGSNFSTTGSENTYISKTSISGDSDITSITENTTLGDITLTNANLNIKDITENNYETITLAGDENIIWSDNSTIRDLSVGNNSLSIISENGTTTINNISSDEDSTSVIELGAEAGANLTAATGTQIILNGNDTLRTETEAQTATKSAGVINLNGVTISGTKNTIENANPSNIDENIKFGTIIFKDGASADISNITTSSNTNTAFVFEGNNIINTEYTYLGDIAIASKKSLEISATEITGYAQADLNTGTTSSKTSLTLNASATDSNNGIITGETTNLKGNSSLVINGDAGVLLQDVNITGENNSIKINGSDIELVNVNTTGNNVLINNQNDEATKINHLNYKATGDTVNLNGNYNVSNIDLNGSNTLNTSGTVNITNVDFNALQAGQTIADEFTLNATSGSTTLGEIALNDNVALNLNLNANGGTISKTSATTVRPGDTLKLSGSSQITMGKVTVQNGATFHNTNTADTSLVTVALNDNSTIDTSSGTTGAINTTTVDLPEAGTVIWNADLVVNGTDVSSDKLAIAKDTSTGNAKVDLTLNVTGNPSNSEYFVDYIKVINTDKGILNTTSDVPTKGLVSLNNHMFYSYVNRDAIDPDDPKNTEYLNNFADNYAPNTIRVTNYDINSDLVLDKIILPGKRYQTLTTNTPDNIQDAILFDEAKQFYYPNMEARAGVENELTLHGIGKFIGQSTGGNSGQLFAVDTSKDNISRTLNIQGFTTTKAVANNSNPLASELKTRSDNGAALEIISGTGTNSAAAKVTLAEILEKTTQDGTFYNITPAFTHNMAQGNGGAIYMTGNKSSLETLDNTQVDFNTNVAVTGSGGAIYNDGSSAEGVKLDGNVNFTNNIAGASGGAIYNQNGTVQIGSNVIDTVANFKNNYATANGAAHASYNNAFTVYSKANYDNNISSGNGGAVSAVNSTVSFDGAQTFTNNYAAKKGGAIYMKGDTVKPTVVNISATKGNTTFEGNYQDADVKAPVYHKNANGDIVIDTPAKAEDGTSNAIYLDGDAELNLSATGDNKIIFNDKIASNGTFTSYAVDTPVFGDDGNPLLDENGNPVTETIYYRTLNGENNVINQTAGHVQYNVAMDNYNAATGLNDGTAGYVGTFNLGSDTTTAIADFSNASARPFQNSAYNLSGGSSLLLLNNNIIPINATSVTLNGTTKENPLHMTLDINLEKDSVLGYELSDKFLGASSAGYIMVDGINAIGTSDEETITYDILDGAEFDVAESQKIISLKTHDYQVSGRTGGLLLKKMAFDTAMFAPQVAVNARLAGQLDLYNQLLHRVDEIAEYRYFNKVNNNNLYAAGVDVIDDSKIDNKYTPYVNQEDGGNTWTKPSVTIETINPTGQDKYRNRAYNTILGYETPISTLKNGWEIINTVFGGYQGSFQDYDNVRNYQNGGSAGYMANIYKNNFFTGGVVMLGASSVDVNDKGFRNRDMSFGLYDVGAAARVGYNVGMGKNWLFQPMLTTSYIYISGLDRHNGAGEKVDLDGTNTIEIAPGFKIVGNYNGWQPYFLFDYTWPLIAKTVANVNNIGLPDVGLKSYVEYGAGIRKNVGERFTGFAEALVRNGGRNGITFQGGLVFKF